MALWTLFKAGAKKTAEETEGGLILLLEKLNCGDIVDEHQLMQREGALNEVSKLMVKAENTYNKERTEYEALLKDYQEKLADAEKINEGVTSGSNLLSVEKKDKLEKHLARLLPELQSMKPRLDAEEQEMIDARDHFNMIKEVVESKAKELAEARTKLQQARRENEQLTIQEQTAVQREQEQKILMGIRQETSSMDTVLNAIDKENQAKRDRINAAKARTDALRKVQTSGTDAGSVDADVAEFLGKSGGAPQQAGSFTDQLAALKRK